MQAMPSINIPDFSADTTNILPRFINLSIQNNTLLFSLLDYLKNFPYPEDCMRHSKVNREFLS